jgi:REP element-mobilizing transposase RayT
MLATPLAYHITFGTYGTRLHGDPRGTVERAQNRYGDPIKGADQRCWSRETGKLRYRPVCLTLEQRCFAENVIPNICLRGRWAYFNCAAASDHVHTLLSAGADGLKVRMWLKRWLGEALAAKWPLLEGQTWWAEGGSVKWVLDQCYFAKVREYIDRQRATP